MVRRSLQLAATLALVMALAPAVWAAQRPAEKRIALEEAKIIVELNATARDVGVQVFLDGEAWRSMKIFDPKGRKLVDVSNMGSVGVLGMTELFFESEEPSLDELPLDEFLALFPAGQYIFVGETVDGEKISGRARFTHAIPDGPVIIAPAEGSVVDPSNTVIQWQAVADPPGSEIVGYEVIVERENPLRTFDVKVPAAATSVTVPPQFLEPGTDYKLEVLAIEAGGNQTISEGSFSTQ
jgi:Fibronectin type III domain